MYSRPLQPLPLPYQHPPRHLRNTQKVSLLKGSKKLRATQALNTSGAPAASATMHQEPLKALNVIGTDFMGDIATAATVTGAGSDEFTSVAVDANNVIGPKQYIQRGKFMVKDPSAKGTSTASAAPTVEEVIVS